MINQPSNKDRDRTAIVVLDHIETLFARKHEHISRQWNEDNPIRREIVDLRYRYGDDCVDWALSMHCLMLKAQARFPLIMVQDDQGKA